MARFAVRLDEPRMAVTLASDSIRCCRYRNCWNLSCIMPTPNEKPARRFSNSSGKPGRRCLGKFDPGALIGKRVSAIAAFGEFKIK